MSEEDDGQKTHDPSQKRLEDARASEARQRACHWYSGSNDSRSVTAPWPPSQ